MKDFKGLPAIGFYGLTNTACIEILEIDEFNERVYYCLKYSEWGRGRVCFSKILSNKDGTPYFINRVWGTHFRIRFDEIIRNMEGFTHAN